jgi:hypothetical protein
MSNRIACHSDACLIFPKECVCCGAEPQAIHTMRAFRAIDFIIFAIGDETLITVPLCRRCYFLRSFCGPLLGMLLVMAAMGIPFILAVATPNPLLNQVYMLVSVVGLILGLLYYRNWHDTIMDRLLAGIAAGKLQKDGTFSLWLKRKELLPQLSYALQPRKYVDTASYATYQQRQDQQLNSWWAKCLVGLFLVMGAALLYYEFTQLEAGRGRGDTVPKLFLAIYKLIGKWPTCLLLGIPGLAGILWGAKQFTETHLLSANKDADRP